MKFRLAGILIIPFLLSCTRQVKDTSNVSIQTPNSSSGIGTFAAMPASRKACYLVNITGPGISSGANSCHPQLGAAAGSVTLNQTLSLDVSKGINRTVDLYAYLQNVGEDLPCPTATEFFSAARLQNIYLVAQKTNVTLASSTEVISLTLNYPGDANTIVVQNSYSASCYALNTANPYGFQISTSKGLSTGAGTKLYGRVGRPSTGAILTGTGIQLRVK